MTIAKQAEVYPFVKYFIKAYCALFCRVDYSSEGVIRLFYLPLVKLCGGVIS